MHPSNSTTICRLSNHNNVPKVIKYEFKVSSYLANINKTLLKTDHSTLQFLKSIKNPSGRLARWAIYLSQYSFDVQYTPGKVLSNADAMSRIPFDQLSEKPRTTVSQVVDEVVVASVASQRPVHQPKLHSAAHATALLSAVIPLGSGK